MDWLKDKKNQPIVAVIAAVIIVGVVLFMWKPWAGSSDESMDATATDPSAGAVAPVDPAAPADPAAAGQPAAPAAGTALASAQPTEAFRSDPFLPVGYKPPKQDKIVKPVPRLWDLPIPPPIFSGQYSFRPEKKKPVYEAPQPARRMAGLMLNDKVYAIIETNGKSEIIQPGDTLEDGSAIVEKIERDKVILKTTDEQPRYLVVSMAANRQLSSGYGGSSGGDSPSSMPGPGRMPGPGGVPSP